jgi:hypothetical protein
LCLFLPRATSAESPFRFIVIDDPVQAMDPAKVDGLARVLQRAAESRQVVVFTHDDRLPEAVRRLRIPARLIQVSRKSNSVVEVRELEDPMMRYLDDARALLRVEQLDNEVVRRVVPGLCRQAIEFACTEVTRQRRLAAGRPLVTIEEVLDDAKTFNQRVALALFDSMERAGDVLSRINKDLGRRFGDTFQTLNKGSHGGAAGFDPETLIRDSERLAEWVSHAG